MSLFEWILKLVFLYKIVTGLSPQYLSRYLNLNISSSYITRSSNLNKIKGIRSRTEQFKYSFFPFCINEWNKLDNMIKKSVNIKCFKSMLMKFFSLQERSPFSIHDPTGVKLLTRLWLKFSHLNKHKFIIYFYHLILSAFFVSIFSMLTFFPNCNECLTFHNFIRIVTAFSNF